MSPLITNPENDNDEDYASSEDSDFAPDQVAQDGSAESSDSDSEAEEAADGKKTKAKGKSGKRKRGGDGEAEDLGFENSGDEGVIKKGLKRKQRRGEEDDEGGEGGLIKTRRQRAEEQIDRGPLATTAAATVDVDALWANMISGKFEDLRPAEAPSTKETESQKPPNGQEQASEAAKSAADARNGAPDDMVTIKRTYNFAGKVHTEEKTVLRDSAEARLYFESHPDASDSKEVQSTAQRPKRPPRKLKKSMFEPVMDPLPPRSDLHFGLTARRMASVKAEMEASETAKKLNTVEKSKMDWAGFVDKEGIRDELVTAGKAKEGYLGRQDFLARVDEKREEEARRGRIGKS